MPQRTSLRSWLSLPLTAISAASALGSWNLLRVMSAFQKAEASGVLSVAAGVAEANRPLIVALYFGIACTLVALIRYFRLRSAPPQWFAFSVFALAFIPLVIFWVAESLLLDALLFAQNGFIANAALIQRLLLIALAGGVALSVPLLFGWVLRVSPGVAPNQTIAALSLALGWFVLATIALHLRNAWINDMYARL